MKLKYQWIITACIASIIIPLIIIIVVLYASARNNLFNNPLRNNNLNNTSCQINKNSKSRPVIDEIALGREKNATYLLNNRIEILQNDILLTNLNSEFVKNCTDEIYRQASSESQIKFDNVYNYIDDTWSFEAIDEAFNTLKDRFSSTILTTNWNKLPGVTSNQTNLKPFIDWDFILNKISNNGSYSEKKIKTDLLKFYNFMFKVYGEAAVLRMVLTLEGSALLRSGTSGLTTSFTSNFGPTALYLNPNPETLDASKNYQNGTWSSNAPLTVLIHEFGHVLDNFLSAPVLRRKYTNDFNALYQNSPRNYDAVLKEANTFNNDAILGSLNASQWKQIYLQNFKEQGGKRSGLIVNQFPREPGPFLKYFFAKRMNIFERERLLLLLWVLVPSYYGRFFGIQETFAEFFAYIINTPANARGQNWELGVEFLMDYLPTLM